MLDFENAYCKCSKKLLHKFHLNDNYVDIEILRKIFNMDVSEYKYKDITLNDVNKLKQSLRCPECRCAKLIYCDNKYLRTKRGSKHKDGCDYIPKKSGQNNSSNEGNPYSSIDEIPRSKVVNKKKEIIRKFAYLLGSSNNNPNKSKGKDSHSRGNILHGKTPKKCKKNVNKSNYKIVRSLSFQHSFSHNEYGTTCIIRGIIPNLVRYYSYRKFKNNKLGTRLTCKTPGNKQNNPTFVYYNNIINKIKDKSEKNKDVQIIPTNSSNTIEIKNKFAILFIAFCNIKHTKGWPKPFLDIRRLYQSNEIKPNYNVIPLRDIENNKISDKLL